MEVVINDVSFRKIRPLITAIEAWFKKWVRHQVHSVTSDQRARAFADGTDVRRH